MTTISSSPSVHRRLAHLSEQYKVPICHLVDLCLTKWLDQVENIPPIEELIRNPGLLDNKKENP